MTDKERFMQKVQPEPNTGCWLWSSAHDEFGYARFSYQGKNRKAHRVAHRLFSGPVGDLCVLHSCDNRGCVNPDHLSTGTQAENLADMDRKGRRVNRYGPPKLTASDAREIRRLAESGVTYEEITAEYGISRPHTSAIVNHKAWSDA